MLGLVKIRGSWVFTLLLLVGLGINQVCAFGAISSDRGHLEATTVINNAVMCTQLIAPLNGAVNVPVDATISWMPVEGVNGYILSIGTSPEGSELVSSLAIGSGTSYTPPTGLPQNTRIYVRISLFFFDAPSISCGEESFTTAFFDQVPACTSLINPLDGSTAVPINTNLSWAYAAGAEGYRLSVGTAPNLFDILNNRDVGNVLAFNLPENLPQETTIYVLIVPYNRVGAAMGCTVQRFTTRDAVLPPSCTTIIYPADGEVNVPLTPIISWNEVPRATGYFLTLETAPGAADILDRANLGNRTSTAVLNFAENTGIFVTITPYNDGGEAFGCSTTLFYTSFGCGPYTDFETGEIIDKRPPIDFSEKLLLCNEELPKTITYPQNVDQISWYRIDENDNETLITNAFSITFEEAGNYRLEVANDLTTQANEFLLCTRSLSFEVSVSQVPEITAVQVKNQGDGVQLIITAVGEGGLEYALNDPNGPYQESNIFDNVGLGDTTVYVRDAGGCGLAERSLSQNEGIPKYFTPNADGIHDLWQIKGIKALGKAVTKIFIFDQYGKLLKQIDPFGEGWDGTYRGRPMPSGNYWFLITLKDGKDIRGSLALKR